MRARVRAREGGSEHENQPKTRDKHTIEKLDDKPQKIKALRHVACARAGEEAVAARAGEEAVA